MMNDEILPIPEEVFDIDSSFIKLAEGGSDSANGDAKSAKEKARVDQLRYESALAILSEIVNADPRAGVSKPIQAYMSACFKNWLESDRSAVSLAKALNVHRPANRQRDAAAIKQKKVTAIQRFYKLREESTSYEAALSSASKTVNISGKTLEGWLNDDSLDLPAKISSRLSAADPK